MHPRRLGLLLAGRLGPTANGVWRQNNRSLEFNAKQEKTINNTMNATNETLINLDLNTNKYTEQALQHLTAGSLPLPHDRIDGVPGMAGFHFKVVESGDGALFHIAKSAMELMTGAVVWGENDGLFRWLVDYRAAQLPWVPGSEWAFPKVAQFPWTACMYHLGIATLSADELDRLQDFRKHLVASIVLRNSQ